MKADTALLVALLYLFHANISCTYAITPDHRTEQDTGKRIGEPAALEECKGTPLHEAVRNGDVLAIKELAKKGGDLYATDCNGRTPMQIAVTSNVKMIRPLVRSRYDVNRRGKDRRTVLMDAATAGSLEAIKILHSVGAHVDTTDGQGNTALVEAALAGREDVAKLLVTLGADPNKTLSDGNSLLHVGAHKDDFDLVYLMGELGTPIDLQNDNGETGLSIAVKNDNPAIINYLYHKGGTFYITDNDGNSYLHDAVKGNLSDALFALIEDDVPALMTNEKGETPFALSLDSNNSKIMDILIENTDINGLSTAGKNYLHEAVEKNSTIAVQKLLEKGVSVDILSNDNHTALSIAIKTDNFELSEILINHKADLQMTVDGMTYGQIVLENKAWKSARALINHGYTDPSVNVVDYDGYDSLFSAVRGNDIERAAVLVGLGVNISHVYGDESISLLHLAVEVGNIEASRWLIDRGLNVNATDIDLRTPLHIAARAGNLPISQLLVEKGACISCVDDIGKTPLHWAARSRQLQIVSMLVEAGACLNCTDNDGRTPLHYAAMESNLAVIELLLGRGGCMNCIDADNSTALHYATQKGNMAVTRLLVERGACVGCKDKLGRMPIHNAAKSRNEQVVQFLIEVGACINCLDEYGWTPLHFAASKGDLASVQLLMGKGACINCSTSLGDTPLALAEYFKFPSVVQYLEGIGGVHHKTS